MNYIACGGWHDHLPDGTSWAAHSGARAVALLSSTFGTRALNFFGRRPIFARCGPNPVDIAQICHRPKSARKLGAHFGQVCTDFGRTRPPLLGNLRSTLARTRPNVARIDRSGPLLATFGPTSAPNSVSFGPTSTTVGANVTTLDQHRSSTGQHMPEFGQLWPDFGQILGTRRGRTMILLERLLLTVVQCVLENIPEQLFSCRPHSSRFA